ncbi:MAG: hypothetical protein HY390_02480 [Deltaproteobacteria bacterium]|nr:hypothetical protein [Deltaproteobacteria bacterium]
MNTYEEITLPKFQKHLPPWKDWLWRYRWFLSIIFILTCFSVILFMFEYLRTETLSHPLAEPPAILPVATPRVTQPKPPQPKKSPYDIAKRLYEQGQLEDAKKIFLSIAEGDSTRNTRRMASERAKDIQNEILEWNQMKKQYLEGYVLFHSYPEKACAIWEQILQNKYTRAPSFLKAKKHYQSFCTLKGH